MTNATNTVEDVWSFVEIGLDCWEFSGTLTDRGYGQLSIAGRSVKAHRAAYESTHKVYLHPNECVLHKCDNPPCCRPSHLFLGNRTTNQEDMRGKGRNASFKGIKNGGAKLTEAQVLGIRADPRSNRIVSICHNISATTVSMIRSRKTWKHI
jgi:HNH endonuclease